MQGMPAAAAPSKFFLRKFRPIWAWSNLDKLGKIWANLDKLGKIWANLDKLGKICVHLIKFGQKSKHCITKNIRFPTVIHMFV